MRALDRKLLRDLARMKGQAITIALVVAGGVAAFVSEVSTWRSLVVTRDAYYSQSRFADVFADVKRAPESTSSRIEAIPGVSQVETRLAFQVTLRLADLPEPAVGRLVSIPDGGDPLLDRLHVRSGRLPERADEVAISEGFATANALVPGSPLVAVINGRRQVLSVSGIALSPEWVYVIPPGSFVPDDRKFGVLWMRRSAIAAAFDAAGTFDEVALTLAPGASSADVIDALDRLLEPYGALGAIGRKDQGSNMLVENEIKQNRSLAIVMPAIFFGISTFLLQVVLARLVATQRGQIASLKALGYDGTRIALHYLELVLAIVLAGAIAGTVLGGLLGKSLTRIYVDFFRFPVLAFRMDAWIPAAAIGASAASAVAGVWGAVARITRLPAAEAMRPEAPAVYRRTLAERLGLARLFSAQSRMVLRGLSRRPARAAMTSLGVAASVAILVAGRFSSDSVDRIVSIQFGQVQREDLDVGFRAPVGDEALDELASLPGVRLAEGVRSLPVRLRNGHHRETTALMGWDRAGELHAVVDREGRAVPLPSRGVLLGARLAAKLGVREGDRLSVETLDGRRLVRAIAIAGVVDTLVGDTCTMDRGALSRAFGESPRVDAASISADPADAPAILERLKDSPSVASAERTGMALKSFMKVNARLILVSSAILTTFASVIALGVVYNAARIALAERSRDLASLRVLGFTRGEVSFLLLAELAFEFFAGLPLGCFLGWLLALVAATAFSSDNLVMPVVIRPATYAFAMVAVLCTGIASAAAVRRMLDRLDLVSVLKTHEGE